MPRAKHVIIEDIVDQHFEEAAFLWSQRDAAVIAHNYSLQSLAWLDERVEAHIDGLRVAGDYGWSLCASNLDEDDPGTVFVATIIAFESGDVERIKQAVGVGNQSRMAFRAMVSALGWMKKDRFNAAITSLVSAKSRRYRRLGIAACGIRRINPREYLDQAVNSSDLFLRARALKAAGELKRIDLLPQLSSNLQHEDHTCRFEAARSALMVGERSALETLGAFILPFSEFTLPAMQVALRVADPQTARNWLKTLSKNAEHARDMLLGVGFTGDPAYIPMLIRQMERPPLARAAAVSFSVITGVDLSKEGLEGEWPDGFTAGPDDDPENENTEMDIDEDLQWPDAAEVRQWWEQHHGEYIAGSRYLAGQPVAQGHCNDVLINGMQSQRYAASLEMALSGAGTPWFNTRAPGTWQLKEL